LLCVYIILFCIILPGICLRRNIPVINGKGLKLHTLPNVCRMLNTRRLQGNVNKEFWDCCCCFCCWYCVCNFCNDAVNNSEYKSLNWIELSDWMTVLISLPAHSFMHLLMHYWQNIHVGWRSSVYQQEKGLIDPPDYTTVLLQVSKLPASALPPGELSNWSEQTAGILRLSLLHWSTCTRFCENRSKVLLRDTETHRAWWSHKPTFFP
jgi:hypothetical protein